METSGVDAEKTPALETNNNSRGQQLISYDDVPQVVTLASTETSKSPQLESIESIIASKEQSNKGAKRKKLFDYDDEW